MKCSNQCPNCFLVCPKCNKEFELVNYTYLCRFCDTIFFTVFDGCFWNLIYNTDPLDRSKVCINNTGYIYGQISTTFNRKIDCPKEAYDLILKCIDNYTFS